MAATGDSGCTVATCWPSTNSAQAARRVHGSGHVRPPVRWQLGVMAQRAPSDDQPQRVAGHRVEQIPVGRSDAALVENSCAGRRATCRSAARLPACRRGPGPAAGRVRPPDSRPRAIAALCPSGHRPTAASPTTWPPGGRPRRWERDRRHTAELPVRRRGPHRGPVRSASFRADAATSSTESARLNSRARANWPTKRLLPSLSAPIRNGRSFRVIVGNSSATTSADGGVNSAGSWRRRSPGVQCHRLRSILTP